MNIVEHLKNRYTTKSFDANKKIPSELVSEIESLLRLSASSTNAQPWHFFIASSDAAKNSILKSMEGKYTFNADKIRDASHVVVMCSRVSLTNEYLNLVLAQEEADGRFAKPEFKEGQHNGRAHFVNMHRFELRDASHWADKQVYLALGTLLLGVATLGIDACPMEGFDANELDNALGLRSKGLTSAVVVSLGYRTPDDFNAQLKKSRLPLNTVITHI